MVTKKGRGTDMGKWGRTWDIDEDNFIRRNYGLMSANEIAGDSNIKGRSRNAVIGRARRLGVTGDTGNKANNKKSKALPRNKETVTGGAVTKIQLARSSMSERANGGEWFKQVEIVDDIAIDLPGVECEPVSLVDLEKHHCRWPVDGGKFCGRNKWTGNPYGDTQYCKRHHAFGHKPVSEHRRLTQRR